MLLQIKRVHTWVVKFVQLPVEEDDVDAFLPSPQSTPPLQLSLVLVVLVVFPVLIVVTTVPPRLREVSVSSDLDIHEPEALFDRGFTEEISCIGCN